MKMIDEKGRLFGKINVIDFLVIIFLFSLTPVFYFGYKIFIKKPAGQMTIGEAKKTIVEAEFNFDFRKLDPETARLIAVGDKEIDKNGQVIGEILSLGNLEPRIYEIDTGGGTKRILTDPVKKHVLASLRLKLAVKQNSIYYKDKQITSDSAIDFITDKYQVEAFYLPSLDKTIAKEDLVESKEIIDIKNKVDFLQDALNNLDKRLNEIETYLESPKSKAKK